MKKISILLLATAIILAGCSKDKTKSDNVSTNVVEKTDEESTESKESSNLLLTFKIEDYSYSLPAKVDTFLSNGLTIDDDDFDINMKVEPKSKIQFYFESGKNLIKVEAINPDETKSIDVGEAEVVLITFSHHLMENDNYSIINDVRIGDSTKGVDYSKIFKDAVQIQKAETDGSFTSDTFEGKDDSSIEILQEDYSVSAIYFKSMGSYGDYYDYLLK